MWKGFQRCTKGGPLARVSLCILGYRMSMQCFSFLPLSKLTRVVCRMITMQAVAQVEGMFLFDEMNLGSFCVSQPIYCLSLVDCLYVMSFYMQG